MKIHVGPDEIRASLVKQLHTPGVLGCDGAHVDRRRRDADRRMRSRQGIDGLNRRIDKNRDLKMLALEDPQSLQDALAAMNG